jgi:hypothetical protein
LAVVVTQALVWTMGACVLLMLAVFSLPRTDKAAHTGVIPRPVLFSYLLRTSATTAIGAVVALAERFWLAGAHGPAAAGHFAIVLTLTSMIHAVMANGLAVMPFAMSRDAADAMADHSSAMRRGTLRLMNQLTVAWAGLAVTAAALVGPDFISLWLGPAASQPLLPLLPWLALTFAAFTMAIPAWMLADVTGKERLNLGFMAAVAVLWLIAAVFLVDETGSLGLAQARATIILPVVGLIIIVERKMFGTVDLKAWGGCAAAAILSATVAHLAVVAYVRAADGGAATWSSLMLVTAILIGAFLCTYAVAWLLIGRRLEPR